MLAATTNELRLAIPIWGNLAFALVGVAYLVLGGRWPRFFDVLSMTVLGCLMGLAASAWLPLSQPIIIIVGGLVLGGLMAFFRNVCHAVLAAIVAAVALAHLAALAVGPRGFASYLALNLANRAYSIQVTSLNLACDAVLAAGVTGLLVGATVAVIRFAFSERLVTSVQGASLLVFNLASVASKYRGEGQPSLAATFPLTLGACWLCLVVIGLIAQAAAARVARKGDDLAEDAVDGES